MADLETPATFRKTETGRTPGARAKDSSMEGTSCQAQFDTSSFTCGLSNNTSLQLQIGVTVGVKVITTTTPPQPSPSSTISPVIPHGSGQTSAEPMLATPQTILPVVVSPKVELALPAHAGPVPMILNVKANTQHVGQPKHHPDSQPTEAYDGIFDGFEMPCLSQASSLEQEVIDPVEEPLTACWALMPPSPDKAHTDQVGSCWEPEAEAIRHGKPLKAKWSHMNQ